MNPSALTSGPHSQPDLARIFEGSRPRDVLLRIDAGGFSDAADGHFFPGSMLVEISGGRRSHGPSFFPVSGRGQILAIGRPGDVDSHPASSSAWRVTMPECVVVPGFVNAHTHLDLTHIGPRPFDVASGFEGWIDMIRMSRAADDEVIAASVRAGIDLCLAGGTVAVGDIGGASGGRANLTPWRVLQDSPLAGTSFLEFFAIGSREATGWNGLTAAIEMVMGSEGFSEKSGRSVRLGIQPHAPNTVSVAAYRAATDLARDHDLPICTHLAESPQEHELVAGGSGPFRALLERLGLWDSALGTQLGRGRTPIEHLEPVLSASTFLLAHVNDASESDLEILARTGQSVVYCPRASTYFGNDRHFGPHKYREMHARGVRVVLGTDSIVNLPAYRCGAHTGGLGVLDEMRLLYQRDGVEPRDLLGMATREGASALGLDPKSFLFGPTIDPMGMVAVPVSGVPSLRGVMEGDGAPRLLFIRDRSCERRPWAGRG